MERRALLLSFDLILYVYTLVPGSHGSVEGIAFGICITSIEHGRLYIMCHLRLEGKERNEESKRGGKKARTGGSLTAELFTTSIAAMHSRPRGPTGRCMYLS